MATTRPHRITPTGRASRGGSNAAPPSVTALAALLSPVLSGATSAAVGADAARSAAAVPAGAGLVSTQTSDTRCEVVRVDAALTRYRRMARKVKTAARLHMECAQRGGFRIDCLMATLTYADAATAHSRDVSTCIKSVRQWYQRRTGAPLRNVWVREFTQAGVPHYHVLFYVPRGFRLPFFDVRGWWPHGHTRVERVRSAVAYMAKYVSKGGPSHDQETPADAGRRMYGVGGFRGRDLEHFRWSVLPLYAQQEFDDDACVRRAIGGGFVDVATGEVVRSPYMLFNPRDGSPLRLMPRAWAPWLFEVLFEQQRDMAALVGAREVSDG